MEVLFFAAVDEKLTLPGGRGWNSSSFLAARFGHGKVIPMPFPPFLSGGIYNPIFPKVTKSCNSTSMKRNDIKENILYPRPPPNPLFLP